MSLQSINPEHVNVLVWAATRFADGPTFYYLPADGSPVFISREEGRDEAVQMLLNTNDASLNRRYRDELKPTSHRYRNPAHMNWSPVEILSAIQFYAYHSGEAPNWEKSDAKAFCDRLQIVVTQNLPGYDEAAWGIDRETVPAGD